MNLLFSLHRKLVVSTKYPVPSKNRWPLSTGNWLLPADCHSRPVHGAREELNT